MSDERTTLDQILSQRGQGGGQIVDVDEPVVKLVIFALNGEWYAFSGAHIREVLPQGTVFFVPGCPPSLEGVINVRGDIESVVRIKQLLGLTDAPSNTRATILIGHGGGMSSGIRVDEMVDVVDLPESAIQEPPATLAEPLRHVVSGVTRHHDRPVTLLDLERIFDDYRRGLG